MKRLFYSVVILFVITNCKSSDVEVKREKIDFVTLKSLSPDYYIRRINYSTDINTVGASDFIIINDDSTYQRTIQRAFDKDKPLPEIDFTKNTLLFVDVSSVWELEIFIEKVNGIIVFTLKKERTGKYGPTGEKIYFFSAIIPKVDETQVKYKIITI